MLRKNLIAIIYVYIIGLQSELKHDQYYHKNVHVLQAH